MSWSRSMRFLSSIAKDAKDPCIPSVEQTVDRHIAVLVDLLLSNCADLENRIANAKRRKLGHELDLEE